MLNGKFIIGLTGGLASGKTIVSTMFRERGFGIIDADEVSRIVVRPGSKLLEKLVSIWGSAILYKDGSLNREKMGRIVFSDADERMKLENILHPAIVEEIWKQANTIKESKVVIVAPLLFEVGLDSFCDLIIAVVADKETRIRRAMERDGLDREQIKNRMDAQMKDSDYAKRADIVIDNTKGIEKLDDEVENAIRKINEKMREFEKGSL